MIFSTLCQRILVSTQQMTDNASRGFLSDSLEQTTTFLANVFMTLAATASVDMEETTKVTYMRNVEQIVAGIVSKYTRAREIATRISAAIIERLETKLQDVRDCDECGKRYYPEGDDGFTRIDDNTDRDEEDGNELSRYEAYELHWGRLDRDNDYARGKFMQQIGNIKKRLDYMSDDIISDVLYLIDLLYDGVGAFYVSGKVVTDDQKTLMDLRKKYYNELRSANDLITNMKGEIYRLHRKITAGEFIRESV